MSKNDPVSRTTSLTAKGNLPPVIAPNSTRANRAPQSNTTRGKEISNRGQYVPREQARPLATRPTGPRPASTAKRQRTLNVAVALVVAIFAGRLVQLQVFSPGLAKEALQERMTSPIVLNADRGRILDRNGVVLATSVNRYQLVVDPKAIMGFKGDGKKDIEGNELANGPLGVSQLLAPLLGQDVMELGAKLNEAYYQDENGKIRSRQYLVIAKDLDLAVQRDINNLGLKNYLYFEVLPKRVYPKGPVAGTLVGFVNFDDQVGQGGIERRYNEILAGVDGVRAFERGANGIAIPGGESKEVPAINGGDVVLTIDADVQWKAQQVIDETVEKYQADHGMIVVQNIKTGELWAVADSGGVDPNVRSEALGQGSRAVQDTFEPGSTGKIITMAAALETGVCTPYTQFTVPYKFTTPNGQTFKDSKDHDVYQLTATGILAKSSNTGMVQIAENIPREVQAEYLAKFHLGEFTGLDLPGESRGKVHPYKEWDGRTRYAVAFGQGLTVNAIQSVGVYAIVANDGLYTTPTLVRGVRPADSSTVIPEAEPQISRVIESETAASLMNMLEQATADDGTAKAAQIPGYRIAGKTGTAEIKMPGQRDTIMASFIGVAPADNPEFVVAVFVHAPQWGIWGGTVAAPAFREVMGFILQQQGIEPSSPQQNPFPIYWGKAAKAHK